MNDFELDIYQSVIASDYVNSTSFREFCNDVDTLNSLFDDTSFFVEEYHDPNLGKKRTFGRIMKNTSDTISNTVGLYSHTTDIGGQTIKGIWDLVFNAINLISRIILWFLSKINNIPIMITKMIKDLGTIPDSIKAKIQGNIKLNVTVKDMEIIYNSGFIKKIDDFINLMKIFRQGNEWSTFFKRRSSMKMKDTKNGEKIDVRETLKNPTDNDMKIGRKMKAIYDDIRYIRFTPTIIDMRDKKVVEMYFTNKQCITFTDLRGVQHNSSYFETLRQMIIDLKSKSDDLKDLRSEIGDKFNASEAKQQFARLNQMQQRRITESIQMISKVVSIVGDLTKCAIQDLSTMDKAIKKCIKHKKIDKSDDPREE